MPKMFVYKLTLEDGTEFNYKFENGILYNDADKNIVSVISSAVLVESFDEEAVAPAEPFESSEPLEVEVL